jgi:surface protein
MMRNMNAECIKRIRIHALSVLILLLMIAGCDNVTSPDTSTNVHKTEQSLETADALNTISDGVHGGTEGFYFLPPMVKSPDYSGTFDAELSPVVEICETAACNTIHASFSMTEGTGSELVRLVEEDEHYIVNWHTGETGATAGQTYRLRVVVSRVVLGHADVAMVSTGREAVEVRSDGSIALVANQTLPVKFRIETGIVGAVVVSPAETTIDVRATQLFTAVLYDLRGEPLVGPAVTWSSGDTDVAVVDGDGLATGVSIGQAEITAASRPATGSALLIVTTDTEIGFFLADNGITIRCPDAQPGDIGFVDGEKYEAVDRALLIQRWDEGANLTLRCTTPVTDMSAMFANATAFNQPIGGWDTGNVTNMGYMFDSATSFNQPIGGWDTGNVTNMGYMFVRAEAFNQDIGGWNTANVTRMSRAFYGASSFNQDIGDWDVSSVSNMNGMFWAATAFNQPIGGWDTGNVTNMGYMFQNAVTFNQPIGGWNTAKVTTMWWMFNGASAFNQDLSGWCVSLFTSQPSGFDTSATSWTLPDSRPIWGTCPILN